MVISQVVDEGVCTDKHLVVHRIRRRSRVSVQSTDSTKCTDETDAAGSTSTKKKSDDNPRVSPPGRVLELAIAGDLM